jgi:hypothetical protein
MRNVIHEHRNTRPLSCCRGWSSRLALGLVAFAFGSVGSAQITEPLIQQTNITYLGAFALPSWAGLSNGAYGTSWFEYGGRGMSVYNDPVTGKSTLFMQGHDQYPGQVAQIQIPATFVNSPNWSSLPMATILQKFADITAPIGVPPDPGSCSGNPGYIYGSIVFNSKLILASACSYGGSQTTTHGVRSISFSTSDFQGWYGFPSNVVATPRGLAGPMIAIPLEWQTLLGGPAFTGNCCISVTGSTSAGPSATVFNPNDVGSKNPIPGTTVLFYPLPHLACGNLGCEATQSSVYNLTTVYGGGAFPSGSRSVLFVTATGTGCYWYGGWNENSLGGCPNPDPALPDVKGPHAPPYQYQILAYDANDLLAVKNGAMQTWQPLPYAKIILNGMPNSNNDIIKGAAYDQVSGRLYIAQDYGASPRIEVYQITVPQSSLIAPANVRVAPAP